MKMKRMYRDVLSFLSARARPYKHLRKETILGVILTVLLIIIIIVQFSTYQTLPSDINEPTLHKMDDLKHYEYIPNDDNKRVEIENNDETGLNKDNVRIPVIPDEKNQDIHSILPVKDKIPTDLTMNLPKNAPGIENIQPTSPFYIRLSLPLIAGFCFGFLGSVPVAGPTSVMVFKLGMQGKYHAGLMIAFGGAISEATYAGVAFWGFGSFLAGAKFLLPVSKVLGAVMFTIVGLIFLRSDMQKSTENESNSDMEQQHGNKSRKSTRQEIIQNILLGLTMSGINPASFATYTGAIASVYGTGMLEFTLFLAIVFAFGVYSGISTWFYLLLSMLKKYKQKLKNQTIGRIMKGMGYFLLTAGFLCAKSSLDYFLS